MQQQAGWTAHAAAIPEYLAAERSKAKEGLVGQSHEWYNSEYRALIHPISGPIGGGMKFRERTFVFGGQLWSCVFRWCFA